ncbi:AraC family transcriptional regulator [Pendulispora rubella]|uniref:AraC family transcriptional regulator n=1 Tax=Pendulispora rubella TaxID=2741070 RepID=A0ABZ2L4Z3_9BACT
MEPQSSSRIVDMFALGDGLLGFLHRYRCPIATVRGKFALGLEIEVQIEGHGQQESLYSARRIYGPGEIRTLDHGELYTIHEMPAPRKAGLQMGFILHPDAIVHGERIARIGLARRRDLRDAQLTALARELVHAPIETRASLAAQARDGLEGYIAHYGERRAPDRLLVAREELERHFRNPLYLRHIADAAGMHPTTFLRSFARRFGTTPIQYRLKLRIVHAAYLAWLNPRMPVADVASQSGFDDLSYFHRAFRRHYKMSITQYRSKRR